MGITYRDNKMHVSCDECSRKEEIYFGEWQTAWAEARADGWRSWKDKTGAWCHRCPTCAATDRHTHNAT